MPILRHIQFSRPMYEKDSWAIDPNKWRTLLQYYCMWFTTENMFRGVHIFDGDFSLTGRILNVETQDMKFHSWTGKVDADESFWYEEGKYGTYFLNIIRLFYEHGTPAYEEVGESLDNFIHLLSHSLVQKDKICLFTDFYSWTRTCLLLFSN